MMSTVIEIIEALKRLDVDEKQEFLSRLSEIDFDGAQDSSLQDTMNAISDGAKGRGMTPEILDLLLRRR